MSALSLAGAVLAAAMLSVFIKDYRREYAVFIGVCVTGIVMIFLMPQFVEILDFLETVSKSTNGLFEKITPLIKAVGIAISIEIVAGICSDAGENSMAKNIELVGRAAILLIAIPVAEELIGTVKGLLI